MGLPDRSTSSVWSTPRVPVALVGAGPPPKVITSMSADVKAKLTTARGPPPESSSGANAPLGLRTSSE